MRTTQEHRDFVVANCRMGNKDGDVGKLSAAAIQKELMAQGLTTTQANNVCRNQRKRLKVYNIIKIELEGQDDGTQGADGFKRWGAVY